MMKRTDQIYTGDGQTLLLLGQQITVKVPEEATGGAYSVVEDVAPPGPGASRIPRSRRIHWLQHVSSQHAIGVIGNSWSRVGHSATSPGFIA